MFCAGGWRTHTIQTGKGFIGKIPDTVSLPLSLWIGVLGVPGLTAWFGLKSVAKFQAGDRVLVTSAAGPVGATAGQLAKAGGAEQVVGIAGSDAKCQWLVDEAGFDAAINYKTIPDLDAAIAEAMPKGVDLLFDNVGNAMVNRVLPKMRIGKGELKLKEERFEGIDKMPEAFCGLFRGENFGRRVVQVSAED